MTRTQTVRPVGPVLRGTGYGPGRDGSGGVRHAGSPGRGRFRTGSAAATLGQLRDALAAAPELRLLLVGHTDNVGRRDYNRDLSLRRAASVAAWLREQGVAPEHLSTDGKGFDEPVAGNATEGGRALNRRVQAVRVP